MEIKLTPEAQNELIRRLSGEYGATYSTNLAMSMIIESLSKELEETTKAKEELAIANRNYHDTVVELRAQVQQYREDDKRLRSLEEKSDRVCKINNDRSQ
jgi:hypothetical protein